MQRRENGCRKGQNQMHFAKRGRSEWRTTDPLFETQEDDLAAGSRFVTGGRS